MLDLGMSKAMAHVMRHWPLGPSFSLTKEQASKSAAWMDDHDQKHPRGDGAIGGRYTYEFTPTTLGVVAKVTCACGDSVDLKNYAEW